MKRRLYAACASVLMLAMLPLNGLSAFAEAISPDAPVPDWVPTDFMSAMEFRNTYGATHIADDRICIVERQETREGLPIPRRSPRPAKWMHLTESTVM
ncbi:MAG: hypothetical protein IJM46_04350 [Oscillospiraceae bacterium]|nr:hypothetical protein [Oscillospiraceae bacterium]